MHAVAGMTLRGFPLSAAIAALAVATGGCAGTGGMHDGAVDGGGGHAGTTAGNGGSGGGGSGGSGALGGGGGSGDAGACTPQSGSCATGQTCCDGLICCSGVPVSPGHEFCGATCPRSDRNLKQELAPVDRAAVLEALERLPLSTWSYKAEASKARHIGPMAQDFMAAFHVGSSDKTILQVDADGVAFAAIQAMDERIKRLEHQNAALERQVEQLRSEATRDHGRQARR
jgi:hypothetical protein